MTDARRELLRFVVHEAFEPVLKASADHRSDAERSKLEHVQRATEVEIDRYRAYQSAEDLVTNFKRDLHSEAAKKIHAELRSLNLPTIEDIRHQFELKAQELGVKPDS